MLSSLKYRDQQREEGFTLIELLVVVIIIGILAAIAIPVFLAQRERAWRSAAQSDLRNAAVSFETYFTDTGLYAVEALDSDFGFNRTDAVLNATTFEDGPAGSPGPQAWCRTARHSSHDEVWYLGTGGTLVLNNHAVGCPDVTADPGSPTEASTVPAP
jgi:type IV pilus assembly protein PilA